MFPCADKDRELSEAQAEIKALKLSERLREKAVEEVTYNFHTIFCCIARSLLMIAILVSIDKIYLKFSKIKRGIWIIKALL